MPPQRRAACCGCCQRPRQTEGPPLLPPPPPSQRQGVLNGVGRPPARLPRACACSARLRVPRWSRPLLTRHAGRTRTRASRLAGACGLPMYHQEQAGGRRRQRHVHRRALGLCWGRGRCKDRRRHQHNKYRHWRKCRQGHQHRRRSWQNPRQPWLRPSPPPPLQPVSIPWLSTCRHHPWPRQLHRLRPGRHRP